MTDRKNIIGPKMKAIRKKCGLTQGDIAARCGSLGWDVSENTITKIERGYRCLTDKELVTITQALRVKLKELLSEYPKLF